MTARRGLIVTIPSGEPYAGTYECHYGEPGRPCVYRRVGKDAENGGGRLIRVRPDDASRLNAVAAWACRGVDEAKKRDEAIVEAAFQREEQQRRWLFRLGRKIRRLWNWLWPGTKKATRPSN